MSIAGRILRGCVLAGGRSSRMGEDKALLLWQGRPLVEHAVELLRSAGLEPMIAGNRAEFARYAPVMADRHPGCGPLAGLEAALSTLPQGEDAAVVFVPVDLPLLPVGLVRLLAERAERTGALATVPLLGGRAQPLCAVYRRALLEGFTAALEAREYKVMRVIVELTQAHDRDFFGIEAVTSARELAARDDRHTPAHRWFANANTPADWAALRAPAAMTTGTLSGEEASPKPRASTKLVLHEQAAPR